MAYKSCNSRAVQLVHYFPCRLFSHRVQSYQLDSCDSLDIFDDATSGLSNGVYKHLSNDAAISVAALRSSDGAILDPDDRLADVVDDREQLAACLSNGGGGGGGSGSELDEPSLGVPLVLGPRIGLMNLRGDGTSASSNSGSPSPTDFGLHHHGYGVVGSSHPASRKDIEVTGQEAATGLMVDHLHLQVRRGSEPALNRISPDAPSTAPNTTGSSSSSASTGHHLHHHADMPPTTSNSRDYKRWSAAPIVDPTSDSDCEERDLEVVRRHPSGPRFARSGARVSMQIFGGGVGSAANGGSHNNAGYRWAEAADNALLSAATAPTGVATPTATTPPDYEETMHRRTRSLRREPVGATSESIPLSDGHHHLYQPHHLNNSSSNNNMQSQLATTQLVVLPNEGGQPLGIHVVPDYSPLGNELGLLVQGVEPGGRIYRDGRIAVHDRIVEINSHPLKDVPFHRAQELFRNALQSRDLRLRIVKSNGEVNRGPASDQLDEMTQQQQQQPQLIQTQQQQAPPSRVAAVSPTRKTPAVVPGTGRASNALMTVSTRKIGKKLDLELTKGHEGLGFSVTTRDNPAGGLCPIYIKNILPRGAAIEDGRLRSGDRLLEVNGVEMTGKTQSEVVSLLRNIPSGGVARLLISRQETEEEIQQSNQLQNQQIQSSQLQSSTQTQQTSPKLPRQMKSISRASEESLLLLPWKQREILTLDIPVHDTEKAGLGISVKGKTTSSSGNGTSDLGIFIKSVLHGGAASRDGRLCTNDQLLHVNGVSLQGRSNTEAMEGLRRAVHQEGPKPGHITLTVARKMHALKDREVTLEGQSQDDTVNGTVRLGGNGGDSSGSYDHSGGSSDQSGSTVIFVSGSGSDSRERNLMKDNRLSGISSDLRNESYYRATHETWNTTQLQETLMSSSKSNGGHQTSVVQQGPGRKQHSQNSPTVHLTPGEVVSIDGDYLPQSRPRPPSMMMMSTSNGSSVASTPDTTMNLPWQQQQQHSNNNIRGPGGQRSGPTDGRDRPWPNAEQPQPPQSPLSETSMRSDGRPSDSEAPTYTSQTSLDTDPNAPGFSRDQFGRQSMSEKRHASLDAKNTDTYQRNKKLREERERQKQTQPESEQQQQQQQPQTSAVKENMPPSDKSQENSRPLFVRPVDPPSRNSSRDIGPTLGLKKSSSLESLQTVVQEIQMQEEEPQIGCYGYHRPTAIRVVRGRGCNESFRAAVDRSYDESGQPTDGTNKEPMETLDEALEVEVNEMMPPPRSPSDIGIPMLNNKNETRKSKKKNANAAGLLLKGLGSMFRFGKHRKSAPASPESGHQSSGSDPTVSGHHSMAGGHMIMPSSGNQSHHHHQSERRSSSGHSGSIGRSSAVSEVDRHHVLRRTLPPDERDRAELGRQMAIAVARQAAQDEQKRIQHHYLRLMDQQQRQAAAAHDHQQKQQQQQQQQQQGNSATTGDRSQRLHQLRAQHQKRHAEQQRQSTHTPTEQFESNNKNVPEIIHGRSASYDPYNDVRKPRSRAAVGEPNTLMPIPAVPSSTSNYNNNYDEFQLKNGNLNPVQIREMQELVRHQRLKVEQGQVIRRQQHYHSQRSARETRMSPPGGNGWSGADRPVSNYFEYESLHIAGHKVALSGPPYKPQQQQQSGNRRPPTVQGDDTTFFRRPDRNSTGHEYGSNQGRASQRESVYGASTYGSGSQNNPSRPAPLTGSKV
ncbi:partitioning defective 3 homolog isoform X7 [Daphnia pulex]|uniref:partitioning defective 3 homolog isoform X7 n=1 Tax=Daphnia pulex TaxID=6669 RepID=UPI001EDD6678|nr:partitioning defective 3 homolog isoform X7 [Daphnia pulex]